MAKPDPMEVLGVWGADATEQQSAMIKLAVACVLRKIGKTEVIIDRDFLIATARDFDISADQIENAWRFTVEPKAK